MKIQYWSAVLLSLSSVNVFAQALGELKCTSSNSDDVVTVVMSGDEGAAEGNAAVTLAHGHGATIQLSGTFAHRFHGPSRVPRDDLDIQVQEGRNQIEIEISKLKGFEENYTGGIDFIGADGSIRKNLSVSCTFSDAMQPEPVSSFPPHTCRRCAY